MELRDGGVRAPILVLYPVPASFVAEAAARRIAVTAGSGALLGALVDAVVARGVAARSPLEVHVEVETGLGRGGVLPVDMSDALERLRAVPAIRVAGIWSHLAAPEDAERSGRQDTIFERVLGSMDVPPGGVPRRHLAASGAILAGTVPSFDAVRPGLATYGLVPDDVTFAAASGLAGTLRPVMALIARPVRVVDLPAGHGVGYGPGFVTDRPSRLATLPVGYGDGWSRAWSNKAEALVRGVAVPLVGRVSMDAVIADVTDVAGPHVDEADEFVLLGRQGEASIEAAELARRRTTNSWEVVTSMSRRLTRVYHRAGAPEGVRTLTGWRASWHASSSGTGISATSRSTPS